MTQSICYKLIWLLKVYMPSNQTEAVLFLTKNERVDPNFGVNHTSKVGCFCKVFKIQLFCCFTTQLVKKLQQWSLFEMIEDILPFVLNRKRPLSDICLLRYKQNSFGSFQKNSEFQFSQKKWPEERNILI